MKLATLKTGADDVVAVVSPETDRYWPVSDLLGQPVDTMIDLIRIYDDVKTRLVPSGEGERLSDVTFAPPIVPSRNVMCVGKNYHAHAHEFTKSGFDSSAKDASDAIPTAPIIFTKAPETVIANGEDILYPTGLSDSIDYEAELGVVMGKSGRGISKADALDHVFGYLIINDMTARDLQSKHKQWFIGKSLDTFCPISSYIVTADEVKVDDLHLQCWVNGELRQDSNTSDLIFDVPTLIETLSGGLTLQPGDMIATGTPAGVGIGFDPPKYLARGDEIAIEISGLGRLANKVA
ncbi:fumarylacetoacetate hydrolase family protein [Sphingomonas ginsenosidivorax]|uniref:Fumarylacetoacetate hydrolase family protein n=1 Tax=Sphingomonas ginsenosidivorax TaxID=862135 RepID=A0A5C6U568_9SPHN|nr:fumarylacetoacetate hydrolase family protein [Sphingomonas ginsenosidivorax]TXC68007.1 fumarylacetoacetate hydrolase family protein [Sphingomonas ginsenosidivorax]